MSTTNPEDELFETCESVGHCSRATIQSAPFHHFYWDSDRDDGRMEAIFDSPEGKGHDDPMSEYGAVVCKTCDRKALVKMDAEDFPSI